ncbi:hypothetical protein A3K62_00510 [Candidatus Pacearchaeota archaeon RBG_16_35_8]|nr:MAG: hypothetical protein A3K62_00510 [Candidatus Pacearchaeota archaeon RBG_16_35_8]
MAENSKTVVMVLAVLVVLLALVVLYAFVVGPAIQGYTVQKQSEGVEYTVVSIMQRAAQCQTVPLTYGNLTLTLVAVECLQQPQVEQPLQ